MAQTSYRELMNDLHTSHTNFKNVWKSATKNGVARKEDPATIIARENFWTAYRKLWDLKLTPLRARFLDDPTEAVEEVIDFLEVDIPAFRCGYEKEYYLQHLKAVFLSEPQKSRLRATALKMCGSEEFRRESRRWARLLVNIADDAFVLQLKDMVESKPWPIHRKAKYILEIVLENRKDLEIDYPLLPSEKETT